MTHETPFILSASFRFSDQDAAGGNWILAPPGPVRKPSGEVDIQLLHALSLEPGSDVLYTPLCEQSVSVPRPPRFSFGECTNELMARYYAECHCGRVGLYRATNVALFGETLLVRGDTVLQCDEIQLHQGTLPIYIARYRSAARRIRMRQEPGKCVLLLGPGHGIYGHWLADFLPKLFVLNQIGFDLASLYYLVPEDTPKFGIEILNLLGITADKRITYNQKRELLLAEELLIPTMLRTSSRTSLLFADAVRFVVSLIWSRNVKPTIINGMSRIFVSRSRSGKQLRCLVNRECIEQMASDRGFAIVHPEQIPLLEQFALFAQAREIIGEYGSALHASIFSSPGTTLAALRGTGSPVAGFLQSAIGHALEQPTGYVFGLTERHPMERFTISEDAFSTCLELIFSGRRLA